MDDTLHGRVRLARGLTGAGAAGLLGAAAVFRDWRGALGKWWSGDSHRLIDVVHGGCWWGWLVAGLLLAGLCASAGWWAPLAGGTGRRPAAPRAPRWFWVSLLLVTLAGGMLRAPRLGFSLYNDEAYAFRRHIGGMVPLRDSGDPDKFRPAKWIETFYDNRVGNNALPFSLSARLSYEVWKKATGEPPGTVSEWALRLPGFLGGTLALWATGCLVWRLGGPGAGVLAAVLTACHPWHMRYTGEARGYALLLLVLPLLFLALHHALRGGRWRAWLAAGALEYLTVSCFFGAVHFLVALNGGLLLLAAWRWRRGLRAEAAGILGPALVCGTLAAAVYLALQTPHFLQTVKLMNDPGYLRGSMGWPWYQDAGGFLAFGFPWLDPDPANAAQISGARFPGLSAGGMGVLAWGMVALLTAGVWRLLRQGGAAALVPVAVAGGAVLTAVYCRAKGLYLMPWYCIFLLPLVPVLLASALPLGQGWRRWLPQGVAGAGMLALTWPAGLSLYLTRSREDLRGVVERVYGTLPPVDLAPAAPAPLLAQVWSESPVYLPAIRSVSDGASLEAVEAEARQANRPLYVEFAFREQARAASPDVLDRLENSGAYERVAVFPGLEQPITTHYLYRKATTPGD